MCPAFWIGSFQLLFFKFLGFRLPARLNYNEPQRSVITCNEQQKGFKGAFLSASCRGFYLFRVSQENMWLIPLAAQSGWKRFRERSAFRTVSLSPKSLFPPSFLEYLPLFMMSALPWRTSHSFASTNTLSEGLLLFHCTETLSHIVQSKCLFIFPKGSTGIYAEWSCQMTVI